MRTHSRPSQLRSAEELWRQPSASFSVPPDGLLVTNEAALQGALSAVKAIVGGVGRLVAQNVIGCKENMEQRQLLCLQDKEKLVQMLVRSSALNTFLSSRSGFSFGRT